MQPFDPLALPSADAQEPIVIWMNVQITRRKSFYVVTGANGKTAYRNRHFWPCVEWLESQGIKQYELRASEPPKRARVAAIQCNEGNLVWQS